MPKESKRITVAAQYRSVFSPRRGAVTAAVFADQLDQLCFFDNHLYPGIGPEAELAMINVARNYLDRLGIWHQLNKLKIVQKLMTITPPTDAEIKAWLQAHPELARRKIR